jgi:hypothetical protein
MRRILTLFACLVTIPVLGIVGLSGWVAFIRPEVLPLLSAYAAKTVCSNVFIAKRDADAVIRTDVQFMEHSVTKLVKIDIDTAGRRVEAALFGLFARRYAGYAEGRGCTIILKDEIPDRAAAPPLPPLAAPDALWPTGETAQSSDDRGLLAALNDPALQGPGMRAIVVVHDGRIVGETYGEGFNASTPLLGWSMTKTVNAALVGMAIKDGKLSLDRKGLFPQWVGDARAEIFGGRLDGHVQRFGIQRGPGPRHRSRAYGVFGEGCGGFREGSCARRRARHEIPLRVGIVSPVGADLAERDWSGSAVLSARAIVQARGHDQRRSRVRSVRHIPRRSLSLRQCA